MTAEKITRLRQKQWNPLQQLNCLTELQTKVLSFQFTQGDDDSTTEAQIREKVTYEVEKDSDIIHMKRSLTTRLYNLSQNEKFDNCSPLSQKVINYLVKCFSYATAQNKRDSKGIQPAIKSTVPHAFGDHSNCETRWCKFKSNPVTYKNKELPYGKDLHGKKVRGSTK